MKAKAMKSCLYECEVMHHRLAPKEHRFTYNVFMFYLDLAEVEALGEKMKLFSFNRFNWFNFRDKDHVQFPFGNKYPGKSVRKNIRDYLQSENIHADGRIMLLTNVATLGYAFNPISIYVCFDEQDQPMCSVAEVCNTHGEMKLYLLNTENFSEGIFHRRASKLFYVSPFSDLDSSFDFNFNVPDSQVNMRIDDYQNGKRFLLTALTGVKKKLSDTNLLWYAVRFPFITIKIIAMIYWQALRLKFKQVPFQEKSANQQLQQGHYQYK